MNLRKLFNRWDRKSGNGEVEPVRIIPDEESEVDDTATLLIKVSKGAKKFCDEATDFAEETSLNLEIPDVR